MAGHSKWSKVKHIKGPLDVKRGAAFSKLVKEITVAARLGGGDLSGNPRLRSVVETARAANMPRDNIERAIKKGTGELEEAHYKKVPYEGYAPGGVALITTAATDNKNRTAADLRLILGKHHGSLAVSGSVLYMFHKKGQITVPRSLTDEDRLLELTLDAGEISTEETHYLVTTPPDRLYAAAEALRVGGIDSDSQKHTYLPDNTVSVADENTAAQVPKPHEALEACDDTPNVYSNFELPDDILARLSV